jgi:hypothetical protein
MNRNLILKVFRQWLIRTQCNIENAQPLNEQKSHPESFFRRWLIRTHRTIKTAQPPIEQKSHPESFFASGLYVPGVAPILESSNRRSDKEPCRGQRSLDLTGGVAAFAGETDNSSERVGES